MLCLVFRLEVSLGQSEQRVCELSQALAQSEEQLSQLQVLSQSQSVQIQQLQDLCTQLSGVREMNEVCFSDLNTYTCIACIYLFCFNSLRSL